MITIQQLLSKNASSPATVAVRTSADQADEILQQAEDVLRRGLVNFQRYLPRNPEARAESTATGALQRPGRICSLCQGNLPIYPWIVSAKKKFQKEINSFSIEEMYAYHMSIDSTKRYFVAATCRQARHHRLSTRRYQQHRKRQSRVDLDHHLPNADEQSRAAEAV